jgi:hypothetical protein
MVGTGLERSLVSAEVWSQRFKKREDKLSRRRCVLARYPPLLTTHNTDTYFMMDQLAKEYTIDVVKAAQKMLATTPRRSRCCPCWGF